MAKKKYYAIKKGYESNVIVESWYECWKLTDGFSGAIFKGFTTEHEARNFLALRKAKWDKSKPPLKKQMKKKKPKYYVKGGVRMAYYGTTVGKFYTSEDRGPDELPWD